jgi:hypothetical protein
MTTTLSADLTGIPIRTSATSNTTHAETPQSSLCTEEFVVNMFPYKKTIKVFKKEQIINLFTRIQSICYSYILKFILARNRPHLKYIILK